MNDGIVVARPRPDEVAVAGSKTDASSPKHFDAVDALRGWAILAVIALHAANFAPPSPWLVPLRVPGVQLFFVLSAFTLCWSIHERHESRYLIKYFIRRFFRLAPMFYLAAFLLAILAKCYNVVLPDMEPYTTSAILTTPLLVVNAWSPSLVHKVVPGGWSITVEANFYLLLPLVLMKVKDYRSAVLWGGAISAAGLLVGICGYFLAPRYWSGEELTTAKGFFASFSVPISLSAFMGGLIAFYAFLEGRYLAVTRKYGLPIVILGTLLVCYSGLPLHNIVMLPLFVILLLASLRNPNIFVVNRLTCLMGRVSYSAYFVHSAILAMIEWWLPLAARRLDIVMLLLVPATFAVSYVTYNLIEQPGRGIGQRLIRAISPLRRKLSPANQL